MSFAPRPTVLVALVPLALACIQQRGNGVLVTEDRTEDAALAVSNRTSVPMEVLAAAGQEQSVSLTCDSNLLDLLETRVEDDVLILTTDINVSVDPSAGCVAEVVLPELRAVENTGSGGLDAWGDLTGLTLARSTGSGGISAEGVRSSLVEVSTTGSGDVYLEGLAETVVVKNTGSGETLAADLSALGVDVKVTGSGDVLVRASEWAKVRTTGSGDVVLYGSPPQIDSDDTGSGALIER